MNLPEFVIKTASKNALADYAMLLLELELRISMIQNMAVKNLNELTFPQFAALQNLTVSEHQEILGKSFKESIEDWELASQDNVLGLCFLIEEQPVGLTLF